MILWSDDKNDKRNPRGQIMDYSPSEISFIIPLQKQKAYVAKNDDTQNKAKLVLCVDTYDTKGKTNNKKKTIKENNTLVGSQCYPYGQGCVCS